MVHSPRIKKERKRIRKLRLARILCPSDKLFWRLLYKHYLCRFPNFNAPSTFTEKMQWMKLHVFDESYGIYVDKYLVRDYIASAIGKEHLIPLLASYDETSFPAFRTLPNRCVAQCNHDSKSTTIIEDVSALTDAEIKDLEAFYKLRLRENYYNAGREKQYRGIKPRLLITECLASNGVPPVDYKFQCIHGQVIYIQVDVDRFNDHKRILVSPLWERSEFQHGTVPLLKEVPEKPPLLDEMLAIAAKLSAPFACVRVDLFCTNDKVYFSELTFSPGNGFEYFQTREMDLKLGAMLMLPKPRI